MIIWHSDEENDFLISLHGGVMVHGKSVHIRDNYSSF